jgi:hypothetical protein
MVLGPALTTKPSIGRFFCPLTVTIGVPAKPGWWLPVDGQRFADRRGSSRRS